MTAMTILPRRLSRRITRWVAASAICVAAATVGVVATPSPAFAGAGIWAGGYFIPDGAAVREDNSFAIFQVVNGGALWITNADEFYGLGYTLASVYVVPMGGLAGVKGYPNNGTLIRERYQYATYLVENGVRYLINDVPTMNAMGYTHADIRVVSNGITPSIAQGNTITQSSLGGHVYNADESDAVISAAGWRHHDTDTTHLESGNAKARLVGGMVWYHGGFPKGYLHRGNVYSGTRAYAVEPVGCIWARINYGYPAGSVSFPPAASISGATEVGEFYRSCRQGSEDRPSPINLTGLGFAKALLNSATFTVCTSPTAADGPRYCSNEKEIYGD